MCSSFKNLCFLFLIKCSTKPVSSKPNFRHKGLLIIKISFIAIKFFHQSWSVHCFLYAVPAKVLRWSKDGLQVKKNNRLFVSAALWKRRENKMLFSLVLLQRQNKPCATSREGLSTLKFTTVPCWLSNLENCRVAEDASRHDRPLWHVLLI